MALLQIYKMICKLNIQMIKIIKIYLTIIILSLLLCSFACSESKKDLFPHKLWLYWNDNIDSAPLITQLCTNAMRKTAEANSWQVHLLNSETVHDYLSEYAKQSLLFIETKEKLSPTGLADLYRLFLVYEHGGMWMDANSFFLRNLSWIQGIDREEGVYNKLSPEPEMIMFTYNEVYGGNKTIVFDQITKQDVVLFPGLEIWAYIAKPKAKFLQDVLKRNVGIYRSGGVDNYTSYNKKMGYEYGIQADNYFIFSNQAFQTTLQQKQREIQSNPSVFGARYAIQHYNIWCVDALQTAFQTIQRNEWLANINTKSFFYNSIEELTWQKDRAYFIKLTGKYYRPILDMMKLYKSLYCLNATAGIPDKSIANEFLFKSNQHLDFVKQLRQIERNRREGVELDCQMISETLKEQFETYSIMLAIVFALINAIAFCLAKYLCVDREKSHELITS